ncbi:type II toxin-antitoxin system PemK/MazF family toxin [Cyclobacterium sp.]|uniref:type II toxin-antitoxin system PemK/MazF family toxin n=1 Tax=Cyclobacterium sp. TaxID=1966343 RepID=UPI0019C4480B|nr:type II toxin-antitoxin system PemK/MazF family toxin [Cyclobacterium sp.]MBD3630367.1 type II toxin-antitoxin system PemK/MazF family toxin [Cyclobacterium sp.]
MDFRQGDIVIVPFPFSDGQLSKSRPAVVISGERVNNTRDIILAQISSTSRSDVFSFFIDENRITVSLRKKSQVRVHKIFVMEKMLVKKKISQLTESAKGQLLEKVKNLFEK